MIDSESPGATKPQKTRIFCPYSSGASGGSLHGGASFKEEKGHFAAWKKGPESRKNEVELRPPPLCCPPEALYDLPNPHNPWKRRRTLKKQGSPRSGQKKKTRNSNKARKGRMGSFPERTMQHNRKSQSQRFSIARAKSQGNSTEREQFSLRIRRIKSQSFLFFFKSARNRNDFRPAVDPKHRPGLFFTFYLAGKNNLARQNNLRNVHAMLVFKGIFGESLKTTPSLQQKNAR